MTSSSSSSSSSENQPPNPLDIWKQIYDTNERAWSAALEKAMGSPSFAEAQGRVMESMLAAQKTFRESTRGFLEAMNVPTREDVARLGELITQLEEKIDQLDDRLASMEKDMRGRTPTGTAQSGAKAGTRRGSRGSSAGA